MSRTAVNMLVWLRIKRQIVPGKPCYNYREVKHMKRLEKEGVAFFPDAPSDRAVKHVEELIQATGEGYEAYIILVIQMDRIRYFLPNRATH